LREGVKDEVEQREEEYREFLQREVGEDLSHLMWVEATEVKVKDEADPVAGVQNGNENKRKRKRKERKEETDEEFLMKCVLFLVP
jgi:protein KRI1